MTARFEPKSAERDRASDILAAIRRAARQEQFLEVVSAEEARARFTRNVDPSPLPGETVGLSIDVPPFDRANVDGFALRFADTVGASDAAPRRFRLNGEVIVCGHAPALEVTPGCATTIATGGVVPRGADAVVMIEHTDLVEEGGMPAIDVRRAVAPGQFISYAGSDIARGEVVLRRKTSLSSREIGMLAACGLAAVEDRAHRDFLSMRQRKITDGRVVIRRDLDFLDSRRILLRWCENKVGHTKSGAGTAKAMHRPASTETRE